MQIPKYSCCKALLLSLTAILVLGPISYEARGQAKIGQWDETVGKKVVNAQGVVLGKVTDTAIDVEHGRYVGVFVTYGSLLGMGGVSQLVPAGALTELGFRVLLLNMDEVTFRNAPNVRVTKKEGPPNVVRMAELYGYYGQVPYFSVLSPSQDPKQEQLGYVRRSSRILSMRVDNLEGKPLGRVIGLRDMNGKTGKFTGVVISPSGMGGDQGTKVLPPKALRYDLGHDRLRLNDMAESFAQSPAFVGINGKTTVGDGNLYIQEAARQPEVVFVKPVEQGGTEQDKQTTSEIKARISRAPGLSHYARNVEVGTVNGETTLRSRVEDSTERVQLVKSATEVSGSGNVRDLLEVREMTPKERNLDQ